MILAKIRNYWQWEYDSSTVTATLIYNDDDENLYIDVVTVYTKSGIGKSVIKTKNGTYCVGSIYKPKKLEIIKILTKYKQTSPFNRCGWETSNNKGLTLKKVFEEIYNSTSPISRHLKMMKIKEKINNYQKQIK